MPAPSSRELAAGPGTKHGVAPPLPLPDVRGESGSGRQKAFIPPQGILPSHCLCVAMFRGGLSSVPFVLFASSEDHVTPSLESVAGSSRLCCIFGYTDVLLHRQRIDSLIHTSWCIRDRRRLRLSEVRAPGGACARFAFPECSSLAAAADAVAVCLP